MSSRKIRRGLVVISLLLTAAALVPPLASEAATSAQPKLRATTGGAQHVLATSALLTGAVTPDGTPTSYYFQYGPTIAYGTQTPTVNVGTGTTAVKVGRPIAGLQQGAVYHYRIVAVSSHGQVLGRDRTFSRGGTALKLELAKIPVVPIGTRFIVTGTLKGLGNASHQVVLQASRYPYLEAFTNIGAPALTDAAGRFAFRVANLSTSTELRVVTLDLRPIYSAVKLARASARVTLRVRSSGHGGLVRLYGTVTPAAVGAQVQFQLLKAARPRAGASEESETSSRYATQFTSVVKKATRTFSRFSLVVTVRHGGRYRAFVKLHGGPLVSGASTQTVVLHAAPSSKRKP
jgi:hypothetical protein